MSLESLRSVSGNEFDSKEKESQENKSRVSEKCLRE